MKYWVSEKDKGQAHAINKGLEYCSGDIITWLNSDDFYFSDTFDNILKIINTDKAQIIFGNCNHLFEKTGKIISSDVLYKHQNFTRKLYDYIIQPSTFIT